MISEITTRPIWVDLKGKDAVPDTVHHVIYRVNPREKLLWTCHEVAVHSKCINKMHPMLDYTDQIHQRPSMSQTDCKFPE